MATTPFAGLRGTDDFTVTGQRPENFREKILSLYPNGDTALTAFLAACKSEKTDDPVFHWFQRRLSNKRASGTAGAFVYEDILLSDAYDASQDNAAGTTVYIKTTAAEAQEFRIGHQVLMRSSTDYTNDINGVVTEVSVNGASSRVSVKLLQSDGTGNGDLSNCDTLLIIGNANSEGSDAPDSVTYDPEEKSNRCQIWRTTLEMTRTAMQTRLRTGDPYKDLKDLCAEDHAREIEYSLLYGYGYADVGPNGKPRRFTQGIINAIKADASANVSDFSTSTDAAYDHKTWVQAGEKWLNNMLEQIFRYGAQDSKMAFCGSKALLGIQALVSAGGYYQLQPGAKAYGIAVTDWVTPFGTLKLRVHPLFSHEPTNQNSILILEPRNLVYRFVQDTTFKKDKNWRDGGQTQIDGLKEGFITEAGLEYHFAETMGYLNGVGTDNA